MPKSPKLIFPVLVVCSMLFVGSLFFASATWTLQAEDEWQARPFYSAEPAISPAVAGYSPTQIRVAYGLPSSGGDGATIAIIIAYHCPTVLTDLAVFSSQFGLPPPTEANFEVHKMALSIPQDAGWAQEAALDVQWSHAIAPQAKILLVEALSNSRTNLLAAVDYARGRSDVVSISMSWGDDETSSDPFFETRFTSVYGAEFFAASGDWGAGAYWPASSANVVGVGGTTLYLNGDGSVSSETGWSGSGGGISSYISKPAYQAEYGITGTKRQIPDVSYNANPATGVPIYYNSVWYKIGGTSAGSPQWAAIHALGLTSSHSNIYQRAGSPANASYFRDITLGSNGGYSCTGGYDLVTGVGSPLTVDFVSAPPGTPDANSVTLVAAEQSTLLNSTNQFAVNYILGGEFRTNYAQNGALSFNTDPGTSYTVAGTSTASTSQEKWVFSADGSPVSGSNLTLYYYNILSQAASYAVLGDGSPQAPSATYLTAPTVASSQPATRTVSLQLSQTPQTLWSLRATEFSVSNPLPGSSSERWSTQTSSWTISASNQLPQPIVCYHQYAVALGYSVSGGNATGTPTLTATRHGANFTSYVALVSTVFWLDADSTFALTNPLPNSTDTERRITAMPSGVVTGPITLTVMYYRQFNVSVVCSGGIDGSLPVFAYTSLGSEASLQLTANPQSIWADSGTQYAVPAQYNASEPGERWITQPNSGTIQSAGTLSFAQVHEFRLNITGTITDLQWFQSGVTAQVTVPGVFNRTSGSGQRVNAYRVDDGNSTQVTPTVGNVSISVLMDAPHGLAVDSKSQYQVSLDASAATLLSSITAPSISGDNYWYDQATQVTVALNGLGSRSAGTGSRLSSYTVNGNTTTVATSGVVAAVNASISSPLAVSATLKTQYQLSAFSGSVVLTSAPSLLGDTGWYDAATPVTIVYDYTWNAGSSSRLNAVSYAVNQGFPVQLSRSGSGTFAVQVTMTTPQTVTITSVNQYMFAVTGGFNVQVSAASPTGDGFFDSGTALTVTSEQTRQISAGTRQVLVSYTLDGAVTPVTATDGGVSNVPIVVNGARQLVFNAATQYVVSFQFKDNSGTKAITPSTFKIRTGESAVITVPSFSIWLNSGTQIRIDSVIWQGAEVKPAVETAYAVTEPLNLAVLCRIYDARLLIQNALGQPVSGARVLATLANQTSVEGMSGADGTFTLPMIPLGTFHASVLYQGQTTEVSGDASLGQTITHVVSPQPSPSLSPSPTASSTSPPTASASPAASSTASIASPSPTVPEFAEPALLAVLFVMVCLFALIFSKKLRR